LNTPQKNATQALPESEQRYRSLFDHVDQGFCVIELLFDQAGTPNDYRFLEVNPAFERHTGLAQSVGKTIREMVPGHEQKWFDIYGKVALTGEPVRFENHADALGRWYEVYAYPFGARVHRQVAVLFNDISDRKRAEERLRASEQKSRAILDSITDAFLAVNEDWRFTYLNSRAENVLGPSAKLLGKQLWEEFPGLAGTDFERMYRRAAEDRVPGSVTAYYPDHGRWYEVHTYPSPDGISIYFRDVNERVQAEAALRESGEALRAANRSKDEFIAMLAHELRNPLAPLRNTLHIMKLTEPSAAAQRMTEMMERQVNHLVRLVDDLLEVARITQGKIQLRKVPVDLAEVVGTAVETSRPPIESAGHRLHIALSPEPIIVVGDAVRLAQVLANLLNNAAKYMDPGGDVWLGVSRDQDAAVISVRDTGIGIEPDQLPQVFELFAQVDRDPGRVQGGLGIGLSLVRSLVKMHGGSVEARSEGTGKGSEFIVRLPAMLASERFERAPAAQLATDLGARRVLVVDDNRDAAESLGMLLRLLGSDVKVAHGGQAALDVVEAYRPAVVLLDIGMPEMDGYEVARRMRAKPTTRDVPLIALTGWGNEEDRRLALEAGFDFHMVKPADLNALQAVLASLENPAPPA
jgi:PAS domain S-box-containing protein